MKTNTAVFKWNQQRFLNILVLVFFIAAIFISVKNFYNPLIYGLKNTPFGVKAYNNFVIFKNSFSHLIEEKQLFHPYRPQQYDVFKYTPTFALFFGLFSFGSDLFGLILWNSLNLLLPLFAIHQLWNFNHQTSKSRLYLLMIALLLESITSSLNSQSNGLMLGLMLFALTSIQKNQFFKAILFIALSAFIKIFGLVLFALFILKPGPKQWKRIFLFSILIFVALLFLPLCCVSINYLFQQYLEWITLLKKDSTFFVKYSVMGWIISWFRVIPNKSLILFIGLLIQFLPLFLGLIFFAPYKQSSSQLPPSQKQFELLKHSVLKSLSFSKLPVSFLEIWAFSWIVWVVIYNHMAESATFVIAVGAIVAYLRLLNHWSWWIRFQLILLFAFTILGPTDIYPPNWRFWIVDTAQLKVFPVILFWGTMILHLVNLKSHNNILGTNSERIP